MTPKILGILIPIPLLFFSLGSRAENTRETPPSEVGPRSEPLPQDSADHNKLSQKASLKDIFSNGPLNHLQDIHNFESIFDDPHLGGMPYEVFE